MRLKYKLKGLDCPNCASKIEDILNKNSNINKVVIDFSKLLLIVDVKENNNIKNEITNIVKKVSPSVDVLELNEITEDNKINTNILRLILGVILSFSGVFIFDGIISELLIILGYIVLLYKVFLNAIKLLFKARIINENLLITISCIGAYLTNNIKEGLMVIILYEIGKILEEIAVNNSRKSISDLMDIRPLYANLKQGNKIIKVKPEEVNIGDIIVIKQGEKVPLDGYVEKGNAKLNTSALTGESKKKDVKQKDYVLSGCINEDGIIEIKVSALYVNSTISKILELTENASTKKAKTENFVSKAAKIYTPIILLLAILIVIILPFLFKVQLSDAIYRALVFLVVSCPCAIAISVPLSYFSAIGRASKSGILIKGSNYLDVVGNINKIVFDKTGTLTTGKFTDYKLTILNNKYTKEPIIKYFLSGEVLSNHPIAKSIVNLFKDEYEAYEVKNYKEIIGGGIKYEIEDKKVKIGSCSFVKSDTKDNLIYLSINDSIIAKLELLDGVKKEAKNVIAKLKEVGIKTIMYTGDNNIIASKIANEIKVDEFKSEMLPTDKYNNLLKEIENNNGKTAFVGDGINDAPSLAVSDIGISMGELGSSSAIEASDIVIMNDDLHKIIEAIKISKFTKKIVVQNLVFAIFTKVFVLVLSALGIASMWQAVFADTGVTLLTIINTTRILRK